MLLHDDVKTDTHGAFLSVLDHLDLQRHIPDGLGAARFTKKPPPGSAISGEGGRLRKLTADERERLWALFADDVARLEGLIGRDLTMWRP